MLGSRVSRSVSKSLPASFWTHAAHLPVRAALVLPGQLTAPLPVPAPRAAPVVVVAVDAEPARPPRSATQTKTLMVAHLEGGHPRRALHLFRIFLARPPETATATSVEGLVWLFFTYREPVVALEALGLMHSVGRRIPIQLCAKALRSGYDRLATDQPALDQVFAWLADGITGDDRGDRLDDSLVETVLEALARLGRDDWVRDLFDTYLQSLSAPDIGAERIWSSVITALGQAGDVHAAEQLFRRWRSAWRAVPRSSASSTPPRPPPEGPYLALLRQLALHSHAKPQSLSPAYAFLPLLERDGLPATTAVHNALLHLELTRRAFPSFWAIWAKMSSPASPTPTPTPGRATDLPVPTPVSGPSRDEHSWRLAIRARTVQSLLPRTRARVLRTPLSTSAALSPTFAPSHRELLRTLLAEDLTHRTHRPSRVLPTTTPSLVTSTSLTDILELLVAVRDWPAASVALESFRVRRLEPSERTHAAVVLGVVRHWEKGRIREGVLREAHGIHDAARREPHSVLALVGRILQGRRMRVGLWMRPHEDPSIPNEYEESDLASTSDRAVELVPHDRAPERASPPPLPAPAWMRARELRDLQYLLNLLERCEGVDDVAWATEMAAVRAEVLPARGRGARRGYDSRERLRAWRDGRTAEDRAKDLVSTGQRYRSDLRARKGL